MVIVNFKLQLSELHVPFHTLLASGPFVLRQLMQFCVFRARGWQRRTPGL